MSLIRVPRMDKHIRFFAWMALAFGSLSIGAISCSAADPQPMETIPLARKAVAEAEKVFGPEGLSTSDPLNELALLLYNHGDYAEAETLFLRVLKIREAAMAKDAPAILDAVDTLALFYHDRDVLDRKDSGAFYKTESFLRRAIKSRDDKVEIPKSQSAPPMSPAREDEAITIASYLPDRLLELRTPGHPAGPADEFFNRALIRLADGDNAIAEQLLRASLRLIDSSPGAEQIPAARACKVLAVVDIDSGNYTEAEQLLSRALRICANIRGPEDAETGSVRCDLARLYDAMGIHSASHSLYEEALAAFLKYPGTPDSVICMNNYGVLCRSGGDYAKATDLFKQAFYNAEKAGVTSYRCSDPLISNLGRLSANLGDTASANALFQKILTLRKTPQNAESINYLAGWLNRKIKNPADEPHSVTFVPGIAGLKWPFNANSPDDCNARAWQLFQAGKGGDALQWATRAVDLREAYLQRPYSYDSEEEARPGNNQPEAFSVPCSLGDPGLIARTILHQKGAAFDAADEDRQVAAAHPGDTGDCLLQKLRASSRLLLYFELNHPQPATGEALAIWKDQQDEAMFYNHVFEEQLKSLAGDKLHFRRRAFQATLAQVQVRLGAKKTLVEFVCYNRILDSGAKELRYGALVVSAAGNPAWVPLDTSANTLDQEIARYQRAMEDAAISETDMRKLLGDLYDHVWSPVDRKIPAGVDTIVISPDSQLNFLSFATLLTSDGKFLAQKYLLSYVSSGRDLLADAAAVSTHDMTVVADPQFDLTLPQTHELPNAPYAPLARTTGNFKPWPPLPGTLVECNALADNASRWGLLQTRVIKGANATKSALMRIHHPWILHLATHGFFWEPVETDSLDPDAIQRGTRGRPLAAVLSNPMYRSGIALAGANTTLDRWKQGEVPPIEEDGILLADEAAQLDLQGTWLVSLSACQTGMGESRSGEGVLGLRRAFIQAGAQNLLLTLWRVNDRYSSAWMTKFYSLAIPGGDLANSLALVQRNELSDLLASEGLVSAAQKAGPYILTGAPK